MGSPAQGDRSLRWMAILGVLALNAIGIAFAVAIDSGATWLELVFRCVVFVVAAALVLPVCADAISQMRSNYCEFAGGGTASVSLRNRLLVHALTLLPALLALALLCDLVRSWFMPAVIGDNPMLLFLLLVGPYAIRSGTRRMIRRLISR